MVDIGGSVLPSLVSALFGVVVTLGAQCVIRCFASRNPLKVEAIRSPAPPLWFACNLPSDECLGDGLVFEKSVFETGAFCGFAKMNVRVTNSSQDVVYIEDISVNKRLVSDEYDTRVRFIPQGGSSAIRLNCNLENDKPFFLSGLTKTIGRAPGYFQQRNGIKIAPGETELLLLGFVTVNTPWSFNCFLHYTIRGKRCIYESLFPHDLVIVPYIPERFEHDYCGLIRRAVPEANEEFTGAKFFTESMRNMRAFSGGAPQSTIAYLQSMLDPH